MGSQLGGTERPDTAAKRPSGAGTNLGQSEVTRSPGAGGGVSVVRAAPLRCWLGAMAQHERGTHLLHLQPHGFQALGVAFLQDAQLRLGQVQGRAASSVQGIYPGPCGSRQR